MFLAKNNKKLYFDFSAHKSSNFKQIFNKKCNMVTPQFFCPLERACLILQFKIQLFSLKFHDFQFKQYIIDRMTCSYKFGCIFSSPVGSLCHTPGVVLRPS